LFLTVGAFKVRASDRWNGGPIFLQSRWRWHGTPSTSYQIQLRWYHEAKTLKLERLYGVIRTIFLHGYISWWLNITFQADNRTALSFLIGLMTCSVASTVMNDVLIEQCTLDFRWRTFCFSCLPPSFDTLYCCHDLSCLSTKTLDQNIIILHWNRGVRQSNIPLERVRAISRILELDGNIAHLRKRENVMVSYL
jgi:hypothetical protein